MVDLNHKLKHDSLQIYHLKLTRAQEIGCSLSEMPQWCSDPSSAGVRKFQNELSSLSLSPRKTNVGARKKEYFRPDLAELTNIIELFGVTYQIKTRQKLALA
jgi:hypothetical protein